MVLVVVKVGPLVIVVVAGVSQSVDVVVELVEVAETIRAGYGYCRSVFILPVISVGCAVAFALVATFPPLGSPRLVSVVLSLARVWLRRIRLFRS